MKTLDKCIKIRIGGRNGIELLNIYAYMVVLLPILNQYKVFSINFFDIFNIIAVFVFMGYRMKVKTEFLPYCFYSFILMIIMSFSLHDLSVFILLKKMIVYGALLVNVYCYGINHFNMERAYIFYSKVVAVITASIFVQTILYYGQGIKLILIMPFGTLNYGEDMSAVGYINYLRGLQSSFRPASVFMEPAMFAVYLLPWIFITLFFRKDSINNKVILKVGIVSLFVCLSTSSLGLLGVLVAWVIYIEKLLFVSERKKLCLLLPAILIIGTYLLSLDSILAQISSKMHSLQNITRETSLSLRLFRGWYCFQELPDLNKIFGTGYGLIYQFFQQYEIKTILDTDNSLITYMNGFFTMLCSVGIIGTALYIVPLFSIVRKSKRVFILLIFWLLLQYTAQMYDTPLLLLLTLFIFGIAKNGGRVDEFSKKHIKLSGKVISYGGLPR